MFLEIDILVNTGVDEAIHFQNIQIEILFSDFIPVFNA
jgi:hypothetical protein